MTRGRTTDAPALELAVSKLPAVRSGRVTAAGAPTGEWLIAVEATGAVAAADDVRALEHDVRRAAVRVSSAQPDAVVVVAGTLEPW